MKSPIQRQQRTPASHRRLVPFKLPEQGVGPNHSHSAWVVQPAAHEYGVVLGPFQHAILFSRIPCGPGTNFMSILCTLGLQVFLWSMSPFFSPALNLQLPVVCLVHESLALISKVIF